MILSHNRLIELLHYNIDTGIFTWKKQKGKNKPGDVVKRVSDTGYNIVMLDRKLYKAHKLALYYVYGIYPDKSVDHINGIKTDNRFDNLRLATKSENAFNMKLKVNNTSGVKGVSWRTDRNKWRVYIKVNGIYESFGHFSTLEEAREVAYTARQHRHGEFARYA